MTKSEAFKEVSKSILTIEDINFEKIWKLYNKPKSNKHIAYKVYLKKWEDVDIEALLYVIKLWLEDEADKNYLPHLENFLNNILEDYVLENIQKEI